MTNKAVATLFLEMVTKGEIEAAYEKYVAADLRHHNAYHKDGRDALMQGMIESHERFPNKEFELLRAAEEGDLVMTHSRVRLDKELPEIAVVHIFRLENGKIAELWDVAQQNSDSPNENGAF